jgi:hypothetical protein
VLLACAWELDQLEPDARRALAAALAVAQIPWLLTYGRVWMLPLRGVEIALAVTAVCALILGLRSVRRADQRNLTM